ncbi:MAG: ArsA family ATPase [Caldilineae bacterium]|nr:ArsA family ATPase [Anaerolineae bacterium]MCB0199265.1 ArsA family ATPase [Anaerolineae bacterium]MCB0203610.1 ArsA family ATPase [Anaerolineae bacterium]MCB9152832.1 ArsA family ATPase [Caldilineae bacterium]
MRILMFTGKGGVGKTSISASTALRSADLGYRTMVLSTDPAHSLADSFDMRIGNEPTQLAPSLWGQEVDLLHQMEKHWGNVQEYLSAVFVWRGMNDLVAEETSVLPGMEELASLMQITDLAESGDYDVVVVDCAPTGATLQLLAFPELARWYLDKIIPFEKSLLKVAGPMIKRMIEVPLPDEELFASVEQLVVQLESMRGLLSQPDVTSMRLVLNPEKMVVKEAQRAYTYLNLYGYATDLIVCNRMIPASVTDGYFANWRDIQARYHEFVEEAFSPLPIFDVPYFPTEVVGVDALRAMGEALYGDVDPTGLFYTGQQQEVVKMNGSYQLRLPLPFVEKSDIKLTRSMHDELIVHIGNWKRNIALPRILSGLPVSGARYDEQQLVVSFKASVNGAAE